MYNSGIPRNHKKLATWLFIGVVMLVIQIVLGGITRLTESGLSITEWKPITGILPPLNNDQWQVEFAKYRHTDQFKFVHPSFTLSDFKFIFFWEWLHRVWARLMGLVFIAGFIYLLVKKEFTKGMIVPMIILFILGAMQGAIGWIMVKSGLVPEKYFVGHVELTVHFVAAIILLVYTLWFALHLIEGFRKKIYDPGLRRFLILIATVMFLQLIYGGFMAGMKAGMVAPTWPDINGRMIPNGIDQYSSFLTNIVQNPIAVQFIHRGLAYLLFVLVILFYVQTKTSRNNIMFRKLRVLLLFLTITQVILGISTVLNATFPNRLVWLGVSHQLTAIFMVMCLTALIYLTRLKPGPVLS
jgi:heme a synthase